MCTLEVKSQGLSDADAAYWDALGQEDSMKKSFMFAARAMLSTSSPHGFGIVFERFVEQPVLHRLLCADQFV